MFQFDKKLVSAIRKLETCNGIFRQLWDLGHIYFTDSIPTAAIEFKGGQALRFLFNQEFYDSLTSYELAFIIAHECLHVMLQHGQRLHRSTTFTLNPRLFNIAADVAIHELLFHKFGFDRKQISKDICTVESIFQDKLDTIQRNQTLEYYFNQLVDGKEVQYVALDTHMFDGADADGIIRKALDKLTTDEYEEIKNKCKSHCDDSKAGNGEGTNWYQVTIAPVQKQKWEMVIKEWAQAFLQSDKYDWKRPSRRTAFLNSGLIMPSFLEQEYKRVKVWLYMDTSGSCIELADRFFSAAASLPPKFFDPRLFCFDVDIYETDIHSRQVYGGGGTAFDIIDTHLRKQGEHPDFVFVITDGHGNEVKPEQPNKWHVFLTTDNKSCFPDNCVFHSFEEFQ